MNPEKLFNSLDIKLENNIGDTLQDDMITRYDEEDDLRIMGSNDIFSGQDTLFMNSEAEDDNEPDDIIIQHMDIRQPLSELRLHLEQKCGVSLKKYEFWLQNAQVLEPHKNLVDQCVKGEGLVQINAQIQTINRRINIVDVLKPTDDALEQIGNSTNTVSATILPELVEDDSTTGDSVQSNSVEDDRERDVKWIIDENYKRDQARLNIPDDPMEWTSAQVKHWLQWAVRQFNLSQIKLHDWCITGTQLCELSFDEFTKKVPSDPGSTFYTHLELLRKCKFVAVHQVCKDLDSEMGDETQAIRKKVNKLPMKCIGINRWNSIPGFTVDVTHQGNRTGNNGQIQLWQFLLEILTESEHKKIIQWLGADGEFKLNDPERVAQLWGDRKNKPAMNYEKLSRALRYYYDGDMISKVPGKRFVYKFVCDLRQLIGYSAEELAALVNESTDNNDSGNITINGDEKYFVESSSYKQLL